MANMSYCRFQNTLNDLRDCAKHVLDEDLSKEESRARDLLVMLCQDIVTEYDLFYNHPETDDDGTASV